MYYTQYIHKNSKDEEKTQIKKTKKKYFIKKTTINKK